MSETWRYARLEEQLHPPQDGPEIAPDAGAPPGEAALGTVERPAAPGLDPGPLLGTWHNTNPRSRGILRIDLELHEGAFTVRVQGAGSPAPIDWGTIGGEPFAHDVAARAAIAWSALFDLGFLRIHLQANIKQGVLVVASFNEFVDDSGRTNYFTREFFFR